MATVTSPLHGRVARGQLGKALVFFPWKGINAVRSYVVPANPKTAVQQQKRSWFADAVAYYRSGSYTGEDKTAFKFWALVESRAMSGFNKYVSLNMNIRNAGKVFAYPWSVEVTKPGAGQITVTCKVKDNTETYTVTAYFDTAQGGTLYTQTLTWNAATSRYEGTRTGLGSGVRYWIRIKAIEAGYEGWAGDYKETTI